MLVLGCIQESLGINLGIWGRVRVLVTCGNRVRVGVRVSVRIGWGLQLVSGLGLGLGIVYKRVAHSGHKKRFLIQHATKPGYIRVRVTVLREFQHYRGLPCCRLHLAR